jgi:hypothetical protein
MLGGGPYEATTCQNAAVRCGTVGAKIRIASITGTRKKRRIQNEYRISKSSV